MHRRALALILALAFVGCLPEADPPPATPSGCPEPTGPGVMHSGVLIANETWRAADGPHLVPSSLEVRATLTIEACVVVQVAEGASINVGDSVTNGRIVAHGTSATDAARPIRFESAVAGTFWAGIFLDATGSLDFEHVEVDHGGSASSGNDAAIEVRGPDTGAVLESLRLLHTHITSSGTQGVRLTRGAAFSADSTDLVITTAGAEPEVDARFPTGHPIDVDAPAVHTLPEGTYVGNRRDEIIVRTPTRVSIDEGFRNLGVPYFIDETFQMYEPGGADLTLTIEAGTTLRFDTASGGGVGLILGNAASGSEVTLIAAGTVEQPIAFTSAASAPAAGDWAGILMASAPATGNVLSHANVAYAGGATSTRGYGCGPMENVGGLVIIEWKPAEAFVTGSSFRHIIGAGIVSGWRLADGETGTDLRADNTFEDIQDYMSEGHCDVTEWHPVGAYCRGPVGGITCVGM